MKVQLEIRNFDKQQSIFDYPAKYKIAHKGRRFRLTKGAANDFILGALRGTYQKGLWVDTVNANIDRYIERYFIPELKKLPPSLWKWQKQAKIVSIKDSYIDFRSAEHPENLEGFGYDKGFLNEAGIILKEGYLWDNAIKPMFWDSPNAHVVIGGTPKGRNKFYELAQRGYDQNQPEYKTFHFTSFDSPFRHIHEEIMKDLKTTPERVARQEIYAEFLEDEGVVFTRIDGVMTSVVEEPRAEHLYVIGCDLAKVQDYTVLTVYDRKYNNQVFQMRFNQLEWPFQKEKIRSLSARYNHALVIMDSTGLGEPIYDDLTRAGVPVEGVKFTNETKKNLIEKMANWIEMKNITMLPLEETKLELMSFTYDVSGSGRITYQAPQGFHDDIVFSHALAIWALQPIPLAKKEENLTVVARDIQEKIRQQTGDIDVLDIEVV